MKNLKLLAIGIFMFTTASTQAQVSISLNIGTPHVVRPAWGPAECVNVDYYYLPDIHAYYDVHATMFVYLNNGHWIRSRHLPKYYRNYDLYHGHKVVLNGYRGSRPYAYYNNHKLTHKKYIERKVANHRYENGRRNYNNRRYADNYNRFDKREYRYNKRYKRH